MDEAVGSSLWRNAAFVRLFWAHVISLVGSGLSSLALGLLAHELVGASASIVLGITLAIRILVIVTCSPWAGFVADCWGPRVTMILSDILRAGVVIAFFFVENVWQIYMLAVLLNLGAAVFTPVYKAVIPGVVTDEQYPRALALGSIAYDTANILGPSLAGLLVATVGFRANFLLDAFTFIASAVLILGVPRLVKPAASKAGIALGHGITSMFRRPPLRQTLYLALQVSVVGGFVLVATVDFIKNTLALSDTFYAGAMAAYGIGSVVGAALYGKSPVLVRLVLARACVPAMLSALLAAGEWQSFPVLVVCWSLAGAAQCILGIRGNELLAANSAGDERPHIYAAHFSLSHAGWGLTYPVAGFVTTWFGFGRGAFVFAGILTLISIPFWIGDWRLRRRGAAPAA
jgi:MFS family permease